MRIAKDFIDDLYVHMGYQKASGFKTVYDVFLKNGKVRYMTDRSEEMARKSGAFKKRYESGSLLLTTIDAFSLDMDIE